MNFFEEGADKKFHLMSVLFTASIKKNQADETTEILMISILKP